MPGVFGYEVSEERALATVRAAFKSPIKFLDTAAGYGDGESERRIGIVLRGAGWVARGLCARPRLTLTRKQAILAGSRLSALSSAVLYLLGLNHFQLVFLHDPEVTTFENLMQPGGAVDVLRNYKEQGLIAAIGVAGGPIDVMTQYVETGVFDAVLSHNRYTLLNRARNRSLLWLKNAAWQCSTPRPMAGEYCHAVQMHFRVTRIVPLKTR